MSTEYDLSFPPAIERIWRAANRKRKVEQDAAEDTRLTVAIEAYACEACGLPLDDDGLCEVHQ